MCQNMTEHGQNLTKDFIYSYYYFFVGGGEICFLALLDNVAKKKAINGNQ